MLHDGYPGIDYPWSSGTTMLHDGYPGIDYPWSSGTTMLHDDYPRITQVNIIILPVLAKSYIMYH